MSINEIATLSPNLNDKDLELIQKAYDFAHKAHEGQKRLSGDPYFNHVISTAKNIATLGMSAVTISAGLLHDVIENTNVTPEEIEKEFGKEIRFLVEGVTKISKIRYSGTDRHNESLRKLLVVISQDIRVLIIKLCDRLHNMQTLQFVPKDKQFRIAKETLEIYSPLAYRLGIRKIQRSLEDLSFSYVYPKEFKEVEKLQKMKMSEGDDALNKFSKAVKKELVKNGIVNFRTDYRVKGLYSLYRKLQRYNMDIDKIYDIAAVRIMVPTLEECYKVLGVIHQYWKPVAGKIKDYISSPKPNGYRSLHTTIFFGDGNIIEVQIRTEEMNKESEYGVASHISYKQAMNKTRKKSENLNLIWLKNILPTYKKENGEKNNDLNDVPKWVRELVEYQKSSSDKNVTDDEIKNDFLSERIFVFTPKGDVIDLPEGSSAIDFAYAIHSNIGDHMSGVKINTKFVAINTILQSGDMVEIETKKNAKPNYKWLEFCKTAMAKRHIRNAIERKL